MIAAIAVSLLLGQTPPDVTAQQRPAAEEAQAPAQDEGPLLTLDASIRLAGERNLDLQAARARLAQARTQTAKAWAGYLPQVSVGASYTRNNVEAKIALPTGYYIRDVGQPQGPAFNPAQPISSDNPPGAQTPYVLFPSGFQQATIQSLNQLGAQAQLSQAVLAPPLWTAIKSAYLGTEVAELSTENARREVLFAVAQTYYGAVGLREAVKVQEKLLAINRDHERDARVRYEAGASPKVALLRAEIDRARSEQDVKRAQNAYLGMKIALAQLLDRDTNFSLDIPPEPQVPADLSKLEDAAVRDRPDVQASRKSQELAETSRTTVLLQYLPTVGVSAVYRLANVTGFTGRNDSWAITVGANWTIFDGGLREANLREAGARIAEAEANRLNAERKAKDDVARAKLDLDSAVANRVKAAEQLRLARENMDLVNVSYRAGTATYLEVADASGALASAEIGAISENLNAALAALRLLKVAGQFNPP